MRDAFAKRRCVNAPPRADYRYTGPVPASAVNMVKIAIIKASITESSRWFDWL